MECVPLTVLGWILPVTIGRLVMRQETAPLPYWGPCEIDVKYFSREVNGCIWAPETSTFLDVKTAGFDWQNRRKLHAKSADASGVRFHSFTSREKY